VLRRKAESGVENFGKSALESDISPPIAQPCCKGCQCDVTHQSNTSKLFNVQRSTRSSTLTNTATVFTTVHTRSTQHALSGIWSMIDTDHVTIGVTSQCDLQPGANGKTAQFIRNSHCHVAYLLSTGKIVHNANQNKQLQQIQVTIQRRHQ